MFARFTLALSLLMLSGCDTLGYYRQAIAGQWQLWRQREDITRVLQQPALPDSTRRQLQLVLELRRFAATELKLPVRQLYASYVDLHREFVVWNVFAAPQFSLTLQHWCYPVAGCVSYRGYFAEADANAFATGLRQQGLDVYVGGVTAYSTLGWFDDPVLSSMLRRDDAQLAATLFHELGHQLLYVKDDTDFNESLATLIEQEGQRRWLQQHYDAAAQQAVLAAITAARERQERFVALVRETTAELERLYSMQLSSDQLRSGKEAIQQQLRQRYAAAKAQWGGNDGYDRWFAGPLNNAQLGTVTTYNRWVPALQRLLQQSDNDLPRFYAAVERLAAMDKPQRERELSAFL